MSVQLSVRVRNAKLDAIETTIGTGPITKIRSGSKPASCAASDTGTVLATITHQSDWAAAAASGSKALQGTMADSSADNSGTAGHWRTYASDGVTCDMQGDCGVSGSDMNLISTTLTSGLPFTITSWVLNEANA